MNDVLSYAILGLVQGLTEFLPISSSGHLIVSHELLGVTEQGLAVDAVLQLATALAVVVYFWKDLLNILYAVLYKLRGLPYKSEDWRLFLVLLAGTVPAIIIGLLLEDMMETAFRSPHLVAYALIAGSLVMMVAEYVQKRRTTGQALSVRKGLIVGFFQSLALIPGMSRSGMTISGGLFLGLSREAAARFGFLLAVPIILGSGLKKLLELYMDGNLTTLGTPLLWGSIAAFVSGIAAIHLLLLFLKRQPLTVFIVYRLALAAIILLYF